MFPFEVYEKMGIRLTVNGVEYIFGQGTNVRRTVWADQTDLDAFWQNCNRSDQMLWLLVHTTLDKNDKRLRLMACDFAETVLHLIPPGEDRPRRAIEVARRYANGEATEDELQAAEAAAMDILEKARDAGIRHLSTTAWYTAHATMDAIWTAWVTTCPSVNIIWAYAGAAQAAFMGAKGCMNDAMVANKATQCQIIRKYFPTCPEINPEYLTSKEK